MELQEYLANRDKKLTYEELNNLKDDYISYYKGVIDGLLGRFTYHLSQFIFFQEELKYKNIARHFESILLLADLIHSEISVFADTKELYDYFEIDKLINDNFDCGDCSDLVNNKYKEEYWKCKYLVTDRYGDNYYKILTSICRTNEAKEWLIKGE